MLTNNLGLMLLATFFGILSLYGTGSLKVHVGEKST